MNFRLWTSTRSRWLIGSGAVLGTVLVVGAPVVAHHVDSMYPTANTWWSCLAEGNSSPGVTFCRTDNIETTYHAEWSITDPGLQNITNALFWEFDPTDLNIVWHGTPSYSGSAETDIIYQQRNDVPSGLDGITWCDDNSLNNRCDQHYVATVSDTPGTDLACHESGPAVGLVHGSEASPALASTDPDLGCMQNPFPWGEDFLRAHNQAEINATY